MNSTVPCKTSAWNKVRRLGKSIRRKKRLAAAKWISDIEAFCELNTVAMQRTEHGYQFRKNEYVINWSPSTNRIQIQFALPGQDRTLPYQGEHHSSRPKILVALGEVVALVAKKH